MLPVSRENIGFELMSLNLYRKKCYTRGEFQASIKLTEMLKRRRPVTVNLE